MMSLDYMGKKSKDEKSKKIESSPILVGINRKDTGVFAHMVPKKGVDAHAAKTIGREIKLTGYSKMIFKSDQKHAIRELIEAVKRERSEITEIQCEESPVGEDESKGEVEGTMQYI